MSRLRELRKERGYTQIKMQMLTGIDQSAYSKIERGERYLSFEQCRRVALALDTSMDYLAGLTDEKKQGGTRANGAGASFTISVFQYNVSFPGMSALCRTAGAAPFQTLHRTSPPAGRGR